MKKLMFAAIFFISSQVFAQHTTKSKSLVTHKSESTGYGALSTVYSKFNGEHAIFAGAYGGWMINHKLMIGLGGYGLATNHKGFGLNANTHQQNNWQMGYGGLMVEYTFFGNEIVHFTANTLVGGGIIKNGHGRGTIPENGSDELRDIDASGFYVIQPSVSAEVNVTDWFRVGLGAGYRYVAGVDQQGISNSKMSAPTANLTLKFGIF
ncbi:MAG: hypothetical protein ABI675_23480 [Chitinophagaceae bacterium]